MSLGAPTSKHEDRFILPDDVEVLSEDGLFVTPSSRALSKSESGARFLAGPPPVLDETSTRELDPYLGNTGLLEGGSVEECLALIHEICKEQRAIVAFRRGCLKNRLREIYTEDRKKDEVNEPEKPGLVDQIRASIHACIARLRGEKPEPAEPKPVRQPGPFSRLAKAEEEWNGKILIRGDQFQRIGDPPIKSILENLAYEGYLTVTSYPRTAYPNIRGVDLILYEPSQKMLDMTKKQED